MALLLNFVVVVFVLFVSTSTEVSKEEKCFKNVFGSRATLLE